MRALARFAMRGPFHAAGTASGLLIGSLTLGVLLVLTGPPLAFAGPALIVASGSILGLVTLRHGSWEGLKVFALATATTVGIYALLSGRTVPMLVVCLALWLPAWLTAINLGRTRTQSRPLLMSAVLVGGYAVAMRVVVGDVQAFWAQWFDAYLATPQGAQLQIAPESIEFLARFMHLPVLISMLCVLASMPLLARWWQAALYNPGGFGAEFRTLALPRWAWGATAAAGVLLIFDGGRTPGFALAGDAFVILVVLFAYQGLAVIHYRAHAVQLGRGWIIGLYVMLAVAPPIVGPILAMTGLADGLANFRRLPRSAGPKDDE